jgi:hypothetical protein
VKRQETEFQTGGTREERKEECLQMRKLARTEYRDTKDFTETFREETEN